MPDQDVAGILAQARRPEHTVALCLRGDLVAEFELLDAEHDKASTRGADDSLESDGPSALEIAQQMETLREQMQASTLTFTLRALPRTEYSALVLAHPPRTDPEDGSPVPADAGGYNVETLYPELVRRCVVDPELTPEQWTTLLDETLSDRQYDDLVMAAVLVNRGTVSVPFSPAASRTLRSTAPE